MESQYNLRSPAVKRLMKEAQELSEPNEQFHAQPLEDNLFEWHFTIRGPVDSEFENGVYHGRIVLPSDYPMKPPSIILLTANGRFETNKKICLSISGHHPETWQPSWSLRTALLAIIGFMPTHGNGAIGSLDYPAEERKLLAKKSNKFECPQCGNVSGLLKPVTEASKSLNQEAKVLGAQINLQGEQEKKSSSPTSNASEADPSTSSAAAAQFSSAAPNGGSTEANSAAAAPQPGILSAAAAFGALQQPMFFPATGAALQDPSAYGSVQQPMFFSTSGVAVSDPAAAIAAAAAAAAGAHQQMMAGQVPLGPNTSFTPMFFMQAPPSAVSVPLQSVPLQNPQSTSVSPLYNFSSIPPIPSQSFFMNPVAPATTAVPGSLPPQTIIHNVISANAAGGLIPGLVPIHDHMLASQILSGGTEAATGGATSSAAFLQSVSGIEDVNSSVADSGKEDGVGASNIGKNLMNGLVGISPDLADGMIRFSSTFPGTTAIAAALPSSLMASVPTVVSGVGTMISGVPAVVPGIHPMVPGIPAQSVLVGVSSLHENIQPVATGSTAIASSGAAPTAVFHWVHYAPTMLPMAISPDCRLTSVYARPRMLTTTNTSQSEEFSRRPNPYAGYITLSSPTKSGDEHMGLGNSVQADGGEKDMDDIRGVSNAINGDSASGGDTSIDNVKQSLNLDDKSPSLGSLDTTNGDKPIDAGAASKTSQTSQSVHPVNKSSTDGSSPSEAASSSSGSTAEGGASSSTYADAAAASSLTELRRRGQAAAGSGGGGGGGVVRAVNQSAELPPDVPRMGGGPIGSFILNVIVVILIGCIVVLLSRRLFMLG